jgi:hypothetical protein
VTGAAYYQFLVFRGGGLVYAIALPATACGATANCTNTPAAALGYNTYSWKVRAYLRGTWQAFSAAKTFTVTH